MLPALTARGWSCQLGLTAGRFCDPGSYLTSNSWQNVTIIHNRSGTREGRIRSILGTLKYERPEFLVVINTPDAYIAASRIKKNRPKVIMALHGIEPQFYRDIETYGAVIDAVVVPSRLALHLVNSITGYPAHRAYRIPAGVDLRNVQITSPVKPLHIVYSGRLAEDAKRVQDIPPILRQLDRWGVDYEMTIAGDGPMREWLQSQLEAVDGKVRFLGTLSKAALFEKVYLPGRVLLITSERETGPLVAWEAMSAGMAVVSSEYTGLRAENVLQHASNSLIFPVGDHPAAAKALQLSQKDELYLAMANSGLQLARESYSIELMSDRWSELLGSLTQLTMAEGGRISFDHPPDGRLARWLGHASAEWLRVATQRSYAHISAGGEWPHSYSSHELTEKYLQAIASASA